MKWLIMLAIAGMQSVIHLMVIFKEFFDSNGELLKTKFMKP